jgi:hypothetical protein
MPEPFLLYLDADPSTLGDQDTLLAETTADASAQTHPDQPSRQSTPSSSHEDGNGDLTDLKFPKHVCH